MAAGASILGFLYAAVRFAWQRVDEFSLRNQFAKLFEEAGAHPLALATFFACLPGNSALMSLGFPTGWALASAGFMPALESCHGWTGTVATMAGAGGG